MLVGWNRKRSELEFWDLERLKLLHTQKVNDATFMKNIVDAGDVDKNGCIVLYFSISNKISHVTIEVEKLKKKVLKLFQI